MKLTRAVAATLLGLGITFGAGVVGPDVISLGGPQVAIASANEEAPGLMAASTQLSSKRVDLTYIDMYCNEQLGKDLTRITLKGLEADETALKKLQEEELKPLDSTVVDPSIKDADVQELEAKAAAARQAAALKAAEAEVAAAASASEAVSLDAPTVYAGNYYVIREGWYALDESIVLDKPLVVEGDVKIVLSGGNTLTARAGILAKTDATITLYGEKSAAGSLVVRKGIVRVLTKDERTERDERIAKIRETDPAYDPAVEEVDPQILFVWPCLEVTAGNRDPWPSIGLDKDKEDPNPELAPARVEEPVLNKDLLTQGYVNIKLLTKHSMLHEGESLLLVDGHYECTVCGGWFDDPDGNVRIEKTVEEKQEISQRQSSALASRAPKTETEVILSPGVKAQLGLSQGSGSTSNTTTGTSSATSLGSSANKGTDASSALALTAQVDTVTISFDANGGSGTMDPITVNSGESFVLPECTFTPPEGKVFNSWNLGKPGSTVSVPIDTTLKAWWKDGSGSSGGNSSNNSSSSANNSSSSNTSGNTSAGGGSSANSNANSSSSNANANSSNSNTSSNAQSKSSAQDQPQTGDNLSKLSAVAALLSILGLVALDRARAVRE